MKRFVNKSEMADSAACDIWTVAKRLLCKQRSLLCNARNDRTAGLSNGSVNTCQLSLSLSLMLRPSDQPAIQRVPQGSFSRG
jgi:hypothetical protein